MIKSDSPAVAVGLVHGVAARTWVRAAVRLAALAACLVLGTAGARLARAETPAELEPLAFLIGEWPALGSGSPSAASGNTTFTRVLQGRAILRTNEAQSPAAAGRPASRHDDLMVIFAETGGVKAEYFDSEGHVIRYAVRSPGPGEAEFLSAAEAGKPRFRLRYRLDARGVLQGEFAIAPPDAPEAFAKYLSWESRKAGSGTAK